PARRAFPPRGSRRQYLEHFGRWSGDRPQAYRQLPTRLNHARAFAYPQFDRRRPYPRNAALQPCESTLSVDSAESLVLGTWYQVLPHGTMILLSALSF